MNKTLVTRSRGMIFFICLLSTLITSPLLSQSLTLSIPDTAVATNALLRVPIYTTNVTGLGIISMSIKLTFNPDVLDALGANSRGTISQPWGNPTTSDSTGQITLALVGITPLTGQGILTYVFFEVIGAKSDTTTIHFKSININEGKIIAQTKSGKLTVLEAEPMPHVRLTLPDTSATAGSIIDLPIRVSNLTGFHIDSLRLFLTFNKFVLQAQDVITTGTLTQSWKDTIETLLPGSIALFLKGSHPLADSGKLCLIRFQLKGSPGMACPIHFYHINFYNDTLRLATQDGKVAISGGTTTQVMVSIPDISADSASTVMIPVFISALTQQEAVTAIALTLDFDSRVIQYQNYNITNTLLDGWFTSANLAAPGRLKFGGFSANAIVGQGILLEFSFLVVGSPAMQTAITFSEMTLNEGIPTVTAFGSVFTVNYVIPVELSSFTAQWVGGAILLTWETASESNNYGFEPERSVNGLPWHVIGFVPGHGSTATPQHYSFRDEPIESGSYQYRLKQIDYNGHYVRSAPVQIIVTSARQFSLGQNYPNPFNPTTVIPFDLPEPATIKLTLYNLRGEPVALIAEGQFGPGQHQISFSTKNLAAGLYCYKLETKNFSDVKKLVILK